MTEKLVRQAMLLYRPFGHDAYDLQMNRVRVGATWVLDGDLPYAVGLAMLLGEMYYSARDKVYAICLVTEEGKESCWWTFADWRRPDSFRLRSCRWNKDRMLAALSCAQAMHMTMLSRLNEEAELEDMTEWSHADYLWWLYSLHQECCLPAALQSLAPLVSRPHPDGPPELHELHLLYTDMSCLRLTDRGPEVEQEQKLGVRIPNAGKRTVSEFRVVQVHGTVGRA